MQPLQHTTNESAGRCAATVLDAVPPVVWFLRRRMRSYRKGISLPQFRALVLLDRQPAANLSAVAEHLGASLPTVSRIVSGLVNKGFLTRQGCPADRRQISLAITRRGREVLKVAWDGTADHMAVELNRLTGQQRSLIVQAMRILKDVFGPVGQPGDSSAAPLPTSSKRAPRRATRAKLLTAG